MIKTLSLHKFKSFKSLNGLELSDLTVIAGKNSCGKSSLLQSLLLLKQTLKNQGGEQLDLDGDYLTFTNLKELSFSIPNIGKAKIGYSFEVETKHFSGKVSFSFKNERRFEHYIPLVDSFKVKLDDKSEVIDFFKLKITTDKVPEYFRDIVSKKFDKNIKSETIFTYFYPEKIQLVGDEIGKIPDQLRDVYSFPAQMFFMKEMYLIDTLIEDIKKIKYLGPLRANPKRAYVHFTEIARELLPSGENAAHILWSRQNDSVLFNGREIKLKDALNECIKIMGLSQEISPSRVGSLIYQINLKNKDCRSDVTISDVGFGYSQVIPIILMCLLSSPGDLILLEQPEIHLHPSSAANLADLFLHFINDGRHIVVETHSAEMISRLRLRVIEKKQLKDKINIVFVENNIEGNDGANVKQFKIDENGMFPEYPDGFLDESTRLADAIIKARVEKNKKNIKAPWDK